jgi:hypothetical protein
LEEKLPIPSPKWSARRSLVILKYHGRLTPTYHTLDGICYTHMYWMYERSSQLLTLYLKSSKRNCANIYISELTSCERFGSIL